MIAATDCRTPHLPHHLDLLQTGRTLTQSPVLCLHLGIWSTILLSCLRQSSHLGIHSAQVSRVAAYPLVGKGRQRSRQRRSVAREASFSRLFAALSRTI